MSKLTPLSEAIRTHVHAGDHIHVAYSDARPNAALLQIARTFAGTDPKFTLSTAGMVGTQHALVHLGLVRKLISSFAGENYPLARPSPAFQRAVREGSVELENWSLWTLVARLIAAALGVSHFPVRSLTGTSMAKDLPEREFIEARDPFDPSATFAAVAPLRPDITIVQVAMADAEGNAIIAPPYGESAWGSLAATRGVVVCAERIVSTEEIKALQAHVRIPAHVVLSVSHVPFGSHPYGFYPGALGGVAGYAGDAAFLDEVYQASKSREDFEGWVRRWVTGLADHDAYLAQIGDTALSRLSAEAGVPAARSVSPGTWTAAEAQVVLGSRVLRERIVESRHDAVLAGVGLANLAAWSTARELSALGDPVQLMAEIGMFGYDPQDGDPFIFAPRNLPTCTLMGDVAAVLGSFVAGPATSSIGIVGAGQVDAQGNVNSTWTADGDFLVGSGGVNDILSTAEEVVVVVSHRRHRLVETLPYVTAPGRSVSRLVTDRGVFVKTEGGWQLTSLLAPEGVEERAAVQEMRASCEWEFSISSTLTREAPPSAVELQRVRGFDPERVFLGTPATQLEEESLA